MTSSIDLASIGFGVDDHRRDQWGRMYVVPPGAHDAVGYTRVTTVAKALDDGGGLAPWKASLSIVGTLRRPGLRARWEALVAATDGDPWYASAASKAECKRLVELCSEAGGSADRAEQGTSLHALTALVDVGANVTGLLPETERDIEAYVNALIAEGITIETNASSGLPCVELTTVLDGYRVAGTADRVVRVPGFDQPLIADLKTGADLGYSWNSIAVQLAAYANGDAEYVQGADPNGSTDIRGPMPDVDRDHGLVIHLPAGEARCDLYVIDLVAGWEAFELSMRARTWRARRDLSVRLPKPAARISAPRLTLLPSATTANPPAWNVAVTSASEVVEVVTALSEPFDTGHELATRQAEAVAPVVDMFAALDQARANHPAAQQRPPESAQMRDELRAWLQQRIDVAGAHSDAARGDLLRSWPAGVDPLVRSTAHDDAQLAAIEAVLDDVEARHTIPFGPSRPGTPDAPAGWLVERLAAEFPNSTITPKETS